MPMKPEKAAAWVREHRARRLFGVLMAPADPLDAEIERHHPSVANRQEWHSPR
jgi:hypothetical protein